MSNEEYWILILIGSFVSAGLLTIIIWGILYANERTVNLFFMINLIPEFISLTVAKKNISTKVGYSFLLLLLLSSMIMVPVAFPKTIMTNEEENCMYRRRFSKLEINGLVTGKVIDKNHATPSLWLMHIDSSSNAFALNSYLIEVYDNAQNGDSIIKRTNSMEVILRREQKDLKFYIDYGCE